MRLGFLFVLILISKTALSQDIERFSCYDKRVQDSVAEFVIVHTKDGIKVSIVGQFRHPEGVPLFRSNSLFDHSYTFGQPLTNSRVTGYNEEVSISHVTKKILSNDKDFEIESEMQVSWKELVQVHWYPNLFSDKQETGRVSVYLTYERNTKVLMYRVFNHGDNFGFLDVYVGMPQILSRMTCKQISEVI